MSLDLLSSETLKNLTEATQKVIDAISDLAAACIATVKSYEEVFREIDAIYYEELLPEMSNMCVSCADTLAKLMDEASEYVVSTSPKQYGIALMKRRERFCKSPTYLYFQKPKKHLPYQRRCF